MDHTQAVIERLNNLNIPFELIRHAPATSLEDFYALDILIPKDGEVCKNLFVSDSKKARYFILILRKDKRADLQAVRGLLNTARLSFVSENTLLEKLNLRPGCVSPFGLVHPNSQGVEVILDRDLDGHPQLGFHPCDNTATIWLAMDGLGLFLQDMRVDVHKIEC